MTKTEGSKSWHIEGNTKHAARCLAFRQELDALDPAGIHR